MQLYKFRSLNDIARIKEIIDTNHFYMANWRELNDPMEGYFIGLYQDDPSYNQLLQDFIQYKLRLKICSFSRSMKHIMLWSHYADQHKGIAICVQPQQPLSNNLFRVNYSPNIPSMNLRQSPSPVKVLSNKIGYWMYENEYRVISEASSINVGKIQSIYFGIRTSDSDKKRVADLINGKNISLFNTYLDFNNNHIMQGERYTL